MKRLSTLFEKHYRSVCAWVRRFGIAERDAEDVAQDIFVAAVEGFERYDPTRPFGPWLKTIASRRVRDHALLRDRDRLRPAGFCWEEAARDPTPEELAGEREHRTVVVDALLRLETELREVLLLSAVEDLGQSEIATLLGLTEPTVQSRLRRARAQFAKRTRRLLNAIEQRIPVPEHLEDRIVGAMTQKAQNPRTP